MNLIQSVVFYNLIFAFILVLLMIGRRDKCFSYIGILILLLVSIFRFDIGNDYDNYMLIIEDSKKTFLSSDNFIDALYMNCAYFGMEPIFELLIWIFRYLDNTYVYVMGVYSFLSIWLWYKILKENDALLWGMFIVFTIPILFVSYDQVRQSVAIALFIFSIKYIEKQDLKHYLYCIILASLFHLSALLIAPVYLLCKVKPRTKLYCMVILIMYIGLLANFWSQFRLLIFKSISFYSHYAENERQLDAADYNSGLGILFLMLFYSFMMIKMVHIRPVYSNILFLGIVLLLFSTGNLNIDRISNYFCFVSMLAFPVYVKHEKNKFFIICVLLMLLVYFEKNLVGGIRGCVPYDSVFSENFENNRTRIRWYRFD